MIVEAHMMAKKLLAKRQSASTGVQAATNPPPRPKVPESIYNYFLLMISEIFTRFPLRVLETQLQTFCENTHFERVVCFKGWFKELCTFSDRRGRS